LSFFEKFISNFPSVALCFVAVYVSSPLKSTREAKKGNFIFRLNNMKASKLREK
jgi:hypothetical protein